MNTESHTSPRRRRVYVVSTGAVTPYGSSADALWRGVSSGDIAIRKVKHLDTRGYSTSLGGEVTAEVPPSPIAATVDGFRDRTYDFMFAAAEDAVSPHAQTFAAIPPERRGLVLGTCNGGMLSSIHWFAHRDASSPRLPLYGPPQAMAEALAAHYKVRGPVLTINTACAAGANALGLAADLIASSEADIVLMGGSDALADLSYAGFNSLGSLSPRPAAPYSVERSGLSLGEGSGMILLVSDDVLTGCELDPIAEIRGYGLSADGYHPTAPRPDGSGAARAIRAALNDAGIDSSQVDYVNSHGTGTPKNDTAEANATKAAIPEAESHTPVSSTKSLIGHLLGAAGAVEAVVTIHALHNQIVPPTASLTDADPECRLRHVPRAEPRPVKVAVSNNFAFGGANASVVLASPGSHTAPPPRQRRNVAITGLGAFSRAGRGIHHLFSPDTETRHTTPPGQLSLTTHPYVATRQLRRMDRISSFSLLAAGDALHDAGLATKEGVYNEEIGVLFGTGLGPMEATEQFYTPVHDHGASAANPAIYPNLVYNAPAGVVATQLRVVGPTSTITTGHASGASAAAYAADHVASGKTTAMLAVASDTLTPAVIDAYRGLDVPLGMDAVDLSEGAGGLLLEDEAHAENRGARIYAVLLAHATASDGLGPGVWDPRGHGMERAMRQALDRGGVSPQEIDVVWTAASGWPRLDRAEKRSLDRLFGSSLPQLMSIAGTTGETVGASGALRLAAAAFGLHQNSHRYALVNSTSWGGTHVSVLLAAHPSH